RRRPACRAQPGGLRDCRPSRRRSTRRPGRRSGSPARRQPARRREAPRRRPRRGSRAGGAPRDPSDPAGRRDASSRRAEDERRRVRAVAAVDREVMGWQELGGAARALADEIVADGYLPDLVLAIARGGLLVAGALAYSLGVRNTFTMNVEFYTGVDERLPMPMILPPVPELVDL